MAACVLAESIVPYAGILIASSQYFYWIVGMETSLFLCLLLSAVLLYTNERYNLLPLVLSLLVLTRFEGGGPLAGDCLAAVSSYEDAQMVFTDSLLLL